MKLKWQTGKPSKGGNYKVMMYGREKNGTYYKDDDEWCVEVDGYEWVPGNRIKRWAAPILEPED